MRTGRLSVVLFMALAGGGDATAAPAGRSRVVVLRTAPDDDVLTEAATRVVAELSSAGFEVTVVDPPPGADPRAQLTALAASGKPVATFAIFRTGQGAAAEVWVADEVTGKTLVRRVDVAQPRAPAVLAVRAVELLRASLLEVTVEPRVDPEGAATAARAPVPADVATWMAPVRAETSERGPLDGLTVGAGVAVLQTPGGLGAAVGPALRLSRSFRPALAARLTVMGPAFTPTLRAPAGSADVRQELAVLDAVLTVSWSRALVLLSVGAGAHHMKVRGTAAPPFHSASGDAWSAMAGAGLGLGLRLGAHAAIVVDVQALFTAPSVVVRIDDVDAARAGRPALLASVGLATSI